MGVWSVGVAGIVWLIVAALACVYGKELQLARYGAAAPGVISDCVPPEPNSKFTNYSVTYRFMPPTGEKVRTCSVSGDVGKQLAAGKTVTVLYDSANPSYSRLYRALDYTEVAP